MIHTLRFLVLLLGALTLTAPALAVSPEVPDNQHDAHTEHGEHAGEDHGGDHEHVNYWADPDGDGTPLWLDSTTGDEPNEEYQVPQLLFHVVNLSIVFGILFAFARRPVIDAVKNRAANIRKTLTDTARERDEAKQKYEELDARLAQFEDEIRAMREEAASEAAAEEAKLIERAEREAERLSEAAERNIRDATTRARVELRQDAVEIAVKLAEEILSQKVNTDDQQRLAQAFLTSIDDGVSADA